MGRINENNKVILSGEIVSGFEFSHEVYGEKFYTAELSTIRKSGTADVLPIMVSDRLIDVNADWTGKYVKVDGQFRSYNKQDGDRRRLILSVFVQELDEMEELPFTCNLNYIFLDGYVCKQPAYRQTPLGREIADTLLAVNRPYKKSDYIPCIAWGRNAKFADSLEIGTNVRIEGRVQSRDYQKQISDTEFETRTVYEVSIGKITVVEESES